MLALRVLLEDDDIVDMVCLLGSAGVGVVCESKAGWGALYENLTLCFSTWRCVELLFLYRRPKCELHVGSLVVVVDVPLDCHQQID